MSNELSIAVTILGILAEATALLLIARYLNSRVPSRWWFASWIAISVGIAAALVWAILLLKSGAEAVGARVKSAVDSVAVQLVEFGTSQIIETGSNYVTCLAFSPEGRKLYVGRGLLLNPRVCVWDTETAELLEEIDIQEKIDIAELPTEIDETDIGTISITIGTAEDASWVASIVPDVGGSLIGLAGKFTRRKGFLTWNGTDDEPEVVPGTPNVICAAAGVQAGTFFCGSADGKIILVDCVARSVNAIAEMPFPVEQLLSAPHEGLLLARSSRPDSQTAVLNIASGEQVSTVRLDESETWLDLSADGSRVVAWRKDGLRLGALQEGRVDFLPKRRFYMSLMSAALSRDGKLLGVVNSAGLQIWDTESWKRLAIDFEDTDLRFVHFSPATDMLAVSHESGNVTLVDVQTGQSRRLAGLPTLPDTEPDKNGAP
jgi:WD40 repeat protein